MGAKGKYSEATGMSLRPGYGWKGFGYDEYEYEGSPILVTLKEEAQAAREALMEVNEALVEKVSYTKLKKFLKKAGPPQGLPLDVINKCSGKADLLHYMKKHNVWYDPDAA